MHKLLFFCLCGALLLFQVENILANTDEILYKTSILEDKTGQLCVDDIKKMSFLDQVNSNLVFGVTNSVFWVKIEVEAPPDQFVLNVDRALLDSLTVFIYDTSNTLSRHYFGFDVELKNTVNSFTTPHVMVSADKLLASTIYIRAKSSYAMMLPITVKPIEQFYLDRQLNDFFAILLIGGLFVMLLYNFILWTSVKDYSYLVYSLGILVTIFIQLGIQGYIYQVITQSNSFSYYIVSVLIGLNIFIAALFCFLFLGKENFSKWMKISIYGLMLFGILIIVFEVSGFSFYAKRMITTGTFFGALLLLAISSVLWYKKVSLAKYFQIAWTIYLLGIIVYGLRTEGVVPNNFFTANFAHIGKFIEVCLMSFALGYKFNLERKRNVELQFEMNKELEILVEKRTKALNQTVQEKEVLLKEIHHRVKNNLQVISSLLNIQSRNTESEEARLAMQGGQSRIKSMALIHQKLYGSDNLSEINMDEYTTQLCTHLKKTHSPRSNVKNIVKMNAYKMDLETTIPIGLIITELVMNSYKYAFVDKEEGCINITLSECESGQLELKISDNGVGIKDLNMNTVESLGLSLVNTLVEQIDGSVEIDNSEGTSFRILFQIIDYEKFKNSGSRG